MKRRTKKAKTIKEYKEFWDGPKVGFNEELYKEYLRRKELWRAKMN